MSRHYLNWASFVLLYFALTCSGLTVESSSTKAEGLFEPIALFTTTPRLSWSLLSDIRNEEQTAYQIQAARSPSAFDSPDLWDTGKIVSNSFSTSYGGKSLSSRDIVYWRARAWGKDDVPSDWSQHTSFELGLLLPTDWTASWIANTQYARGSNSLPVFAKKFTVDCPVTKGRLYLLGLGQHAATLNGEAVSDEVLAPGHSLINKTMFYSTYDVSKLLLEGENVVGVELGKGVYDAEVDLEGRFARFFTDPMQLKLISQLEWECGNGLKNSMVSDQSWLTTVEGPRVESNWWGGETYDARKNISGYDSPQGNLEGWSTANLSTSPGGDLVSPSAPPMKITESFNAVSVRNIGSNYLFDFGVNFAGWYELTMSGEAGTRVVMWMGEALNPDGTVNQISTGGPIYDAYTFSGRDSETYRPKFMYHGFQYLMVNLTNPPLASDLKGFVIRANNEVAGSMNTSSPLFDNIYKITDRAVVSNMYSVMTDCPHREKLGWLEETHLVFDAVAFGYDMHAYSKDMARTISEAQTSSGLVPSIAPEFFINDAGWQNDPTAMRDDPNWGSALVLVPLKAYRHYGDLEILKQYYPAMQSYLSYLGSRASGYLLDYGLGDWADLTKTTPVGVAATFGYQQAAAGMMAIASALGKTDDAQTYAELETNIQRAFHAKYFNSSSNSYATGSQGCTAVALDMGAVPESVQPAVLNYLVESFTSNGYHPTFGEVFLPSIFRALQDGGRDDVLFNMMSLTTPPSYGDMLEQGATSLWEGWRAPQDFGSLNHWMMGYANTWLASLSGISQQNTSVAWQKLQLKPVVVGDLSSAGASHRTPYGVVSSSWTKEGTAINYNVDVPVGSTALVYLSGSEITESGSSLQVGSNGILSLESPSNGSTIIGVGSGSYHFISK